MISVLRRIRMRFESLRVRVKLTLIYLLAGVLPLLFLGMFLIINTRSMEYRSQTAQLEEENKRVRIIVFDIAYLANRIADNIFYDDSIRQILSVQYENTEAVKEAYRHNDLLNKMLDDYMQYSDISIFIDNPTMLTANRYIVVDDAIRAEDWYRAAMDSRGEVAWCIAMPEKQDGYLVLVRKILTNDPAISGVLQIRVSHNFLKLMIGDSTFETKVLLDDHRIFFSTDYKEIGTSMEILPQSNASPNTVSGRVVFEGQNVLAVQNKLRTHNQSSLYFTSVTMNRAADSHINRLTQMLAVIVLISLLLPLVFIWVFVRAFSGRIDFLRGQMSKVAQGNFTVIEDFGANDELGELYADMRFMISSIEALYKEIYAERLTNERLLNEQQSIQFKMLSSQINPHFFFNTLESIRMKALAGGETEVARIIKLLGKSIRHVLEIGDVLVTLESELKYIEIYFEIQAFRFADRIQYRMEISDAVDTAQYRLLPLLIQPIVENAIVHGLEKKAGQGLVTIEITKDGTDMRIAITDNGVGMDKNRQDLVTRQIDGQSRTTSIGLHNIQERIKLYYGSAYGIRLASDAAQGTSVVMTLPGTVPPNDPA